jgi:hypothetical protein
MESRIFIKQSQAIRTAIEDQRLVESIGSGDQSKRQQIQKDISSVFQGLQNPTLMAANSLRKAAKENGYTVDPRVEQRLNSAENCWQ